MESSALNWLFFFFKSLCKSVRDTLYPHPPSITTWQISLSQASGPFHMCPYDAVSAQLLERNSSRVADIWGAFCYVLVNLTRWNHCPHLLCLIFPWLTSGMKGAESHVEAIQTEQIHCLWVSDPVSFPSFCSVTQESEIPAQLSPRFHCQVSWHSGCCSVALPFPQVGHVSNLH